MREDPLRERDHPGRPDGDRRACGGGVERVADGERAPDTTVVLEKPKLRLKGAKPNADPLTYEI